MLVIADRGYYAFDLWQQFMVTGAQLLWRVAAGIKLPTASDPGTAPRGSYLSEINNKRTRSGGYRIPLAAVEDPRDATHIPVRVMEYTIDGPEHRTPQRFRLITTILPPSLTCRPPAHSNWPPPTSNAGSTRSRSRKSKHNSWPLVPDSARKPQTGTPRIVVTTAGVLRHPAYFD